MEDAEEEGEEEGEDDQYDIEELQKMHQQGAFEV